MFVVLDQKVLVDGLANILPIIAYGTSSFRILSIWGGNALAREVQTLARHFGEGFETRHARLWGGVREGHGLFTVLRAIILSAGLRRGGRRCGRRNSRPLGGGRGRRRKIRDGEVVKLQDSALAILGREGWTLLDKVRCKSVYAAFGKLR